MFYKIVGNCKVQTTFKFQDHINMKKNIRNTPALTYLPQVLKSMYIRHQL